MKQTVQDRAKEMCEAWGMEDNHGYSVKDTFQAGFIQGANWQSEQNPWRNFKNERPKSNSHILRRMVHPDYQAYGKVIYYADFWDKDRPDKWEQDNDSVVYEWQYINE